MFDGAQVFGYFMLIAVGGAILSYPVTGIWGGVGVVVGLYFLLSFFNALERRDINDAAAKRKPKPKRKG